MTIDDTFADYLCFLEDNPEIFVLEECRSQSVSLNCWELHLSFTSSPEGQAYFYAVLDLSRKLTGIDPEIDESVKSGLVIRECDIVQLKHILGYMQSFTG